MSGEWVGASYALGRPAPVTEPYPHLCHLTAAGRMTGRPVRLLRRDCAACVQEQHAQRSPPAVLPPMTDEQRAEEACRMGERDT